MPGKSRSSKKRNYSPTRNERKNAFLDSERSSDEESEDRSVAESDQEDGLDAYRLTSSQTKPVPKKSKHNNGSEVNGDHGRSTETERHPVRSFANEDQYDNRGTSGNQTRRSEKRETGRRFETSGQRGSSTKSERHSNTSFASEINEQPGTSVNKSRRSEDKETSRRKVNESDRYLETRVQEIVSKALDDRFGGFERRITEMVERALRTTKDPSIISVKETYVISDTERVLIGDMIRKKHFRVMKFFCSGMKATQGERMIEECKNVAHITKPTTPAMIKAIYTAILEFFSNHRGHIVWMIKSRLASKYRKAK